MTTSKARSSSADGLRVLAALFLLIQHVGDITHPKIAGITLNTALALFNGLVMLYALSAYLLSGPYLRAYLSNQTFPDTRAYFIARFLRICPLYLVAIAIITFINGKIGIPTTSRDVVSHLFFLQDFSPATAQTIAGPLWSMPVFVEFYLFLPLAFWLLTRAGRTLDGSARIRLLFGALAATCTASLLFRYGMVRTFHPSDIAEGNVYVQQLPGMLCIFTLGIASRAVRELPASRAYDWFMRRSIPIVAVAVFILQPLSVLLRSVRYHAVLNHHFQSGAVAWSIDQFVPAVECAVLLLVTEIDVDNPFSKFLSQPVFRFYASLTYGLYLFHMTVLEFLTHARASWDFPELTFACIAIGIPLCYALYCVVEKPCADLRLPSVPSAELPKLPK